MFGARSLCEFSRAGQPREPVLRICNAGCRRQTSPTQPCEKRSGLLGDVKLQDVLGQLHPSRCQTSDSLSLCAPDL